MIFLSLLLFFLHHMKKTVLITGATSGFGKAMALKFATAGYNLILNGRRKERLEELIENIHTTYGVSAIALPFDVRDKNAVNEAIQQLSMQIHQVDILINNAGLAAGMAPIDGGDTQDWDVMIDTNVKGLLYTTHAVLPLLKKSDAAHIINIGSTAGKQAYPNGNVYCATKFAVDALSKCMRIDLLPYGIKVTSINPGMAETEFSIVRFKGDKERAAKIYDGVHPLYAEDVAEVAFYCATLPPHVCINDLTMTCTAQADAIHIHRKQV